MWFVLQAHSLEKKRFMIKLISFKICPFVQRVTALLAAKNIPYNVEYIRLSDKPQWFLDVSPNGQVPLLITDTGIPLFESDAIVEYLDEVSGPIENNLSPEQRAIDRAWSYMGTKNYLLQCSAMCSEDKETLDHRSVKLRKAFANVEKMLNKGPFFKGQYVSNVDIAWLPLLYRTQIIVKRTGYDFLAAYPKVQAWQKVIANTAMAKKSVSNDFEHVFTNFYLSPKTYLGKNINNVHR